MLNACSNTVRPLPDSFRQRAFGFCFGVRVVHVNHDFGIPSYDDDSKMFTPEDILAIRKNAGLSQVKFASALGVSVKKVSAWEHGKITPNETEIEKIQGISVKQA